MIRDGKTKDGTVDTAQGPGNDRAKGKLKFETDRGQGRDHRDETRAAQGEVTSVALHPDTSAKIAMTPSRFHAGESMARKIRKAEAQKVADRRLQGRGGSRRVPRQAAEQERVHPQGDPRPVRHDLPALHRHRRRRPGIHDHFEPVIAAAQHAAVREVQDGGDLPADRRGGVRRGPRTASSSSSTAARSTARSATRRSRRATTAAGTSLMEKVAEHFKKVHSH